MSVLTDQNEWESDNGLLDSSELEFDPAKRRRHGRKGHLNAGLRHWLATHKKGGRKFDRPRHRRGHRVRHVIYDKPRHHRRHHRMSLGRSFHMPRFGKRRYDFGRPGGWLSAASGDLTTIAGGQTHNFFTQKMGIGSKVYALPANIPVFGGTNVTLAGGITLLLNILGKKFGYIRQGGNVDLFLRGFNSEAVNIPMLENVQRQNTGATRMGGSASAVAGAPIALASGTGPAMSYGNRSGSAVNSSYVPVFAYD